MDTRRNEPSEEPIAETPEDVAILYSWANLHGAKYRDFSASRREYRAQVRHRAAEETRQAELNAQAEAERAAAEAERAAREAERAARISERYDSQADRERALREADEAARRAAAERVEAARRAEAAAVAEAAARQEEREMAEAHVSAQRQAARWYDSEIRRRTLAGPQPTRVPALGGDPYELAQGATVDGDLYTPNRALEYTQPQRYRDEAARVSIRQERSGERVADRLTDRIADRGLSGITERRAPRTQSGEARRPRGFKPDQESGLRPAFRASAVADMSGSMATMGNEPPRTGGAQPRLATAFEQRGGGPEPFAADPARHVEGRPWDGGMDAATPAWLSSGHSSSSRPVATAPALASVADTLQHSRERVASRWFALKGLFEGEQQPSPEASRPRQIDVRVPVLAVFSLAGGVGKTSLIATLGRALSSTGEKVLLADTTSHGLLPYYFGATELKHGVVRTFSPPTGSADAPIHLVSYDCEGRGSDGALEDGLIEELTSAATGTQRLLLDLTAQSGWIVRRMMRMNPIVLVPLAPDMNSVISLQMVERYFKGVLDVEGRRLQPYYVINQFDSSLPLHLDVREVLRRQLADRLLPNVIRRSPSVSEALAEGMTVIDYAPDGSASEDFRNTANWLKGISAPATQAFRNVRWSER